MFAADHRLCRIDRPQSMRHGLRVPHAAMPTPKSKESKSPPYGGGMDRSSSLVWMTHSHCVRSNPAKVVGPNPTRSTTI